MKPAVRSPKPLMRSCSRVLGGVAFATWCVDQIVKTHVLLDLKRVCLFGSQALRVGSICTGMGTAEFVFTCIAAALCSALGVQFEFEFVFMCESHLRKQAFLRRMFGEKFRLYVDARDL